MPFFGGGGGSATFFKSTLSKNPKFITGATGMLARNNLVVSGSNTVSTALYDTVTAAKFSSVGNSSSIWLANNAVGVSDHQHPNFGRLPALVLRGLSSTQCAALVAGSSSDLNPIGQNRSGITVIALHRPRYGTADALRENNLFSMSQTNSGTTQLLRIYHNDDADPASVTVEVKPADGGTQATSSSSASWSYNTPVCTAVSIAFNEQYGSNAGRATFYKNGSLLTSNTGIFTTATAANMPSGAFTNIYFGSSVNPQTATRNHWYEGDIFYIGLYELMTDAEIAKEHRAIMNFAMCGAAEAGPTSGTIYVPVCLHIGPGDSNSADSGLYSGNIPADPILRQADERRLGPQIISRLYGGKRANTCIIHGSHGATLTRTFADFSGERGGVSGFTPHYGGYPVILWQAGRNDLASTTTLAVTMSTSNNNITFDAGDPWTGYSNAHPYQVFFGTSSNGVTLATGYWLNRTSSATFTVHPTLADAIAVSNAITITGNGANTIVPPTPQNLYDLMKAQVANTKANTTYHQSYGVAPICIGMTLVSVNDQAIQDNINAFNTLLRNGFNTDDIALDALADIAADPRFDDYQDNLNTAYFKSDKVHINQAGIIIWADYVAAAIKSVIPTYGGIAA